jgi:hypothetical protein
MNKTRQSRKEFLKKLGISFSGTAISTAALAQNYQDDLDLIDEQKKFLNDYEQWLKEFQEFISRRTNNPMDIENNKKLMKLSAQSESRKTKLEIYMKDPRFAKYFNKITKDISDSINN